MANVFYALGYVVLIVGVAYIAHLMRIPQAWIGGIAIVMLGVGLVMFSQNLKVKG